MSKMRGANNRSLQRQPKRMLQGGDIQAHISTPILKVIFMALQPQARRSCNSHEAQKMLVLQKEEDNFLQSPCRRSSFCRSPTRISIRMIWTRISKAKFQGILESISIRLPRGIAFTRIFSKLLSRQSRERLSLRFWSRPTSRSSRLPKSTLHQVVTSIAPST